MASPQLAADDIAFLLAPRLNAAGRLGQAQLGIELLLTDSRQRAEKLASYIDELNVSRMTLERTILQAAKSQIADPPQDPAFVLAGRGWHPGVVGIVAGRICDQYHRPTLVLAIDEFGAKPATGSGRSIPGFNLRDALHHCRQ